MRATKAQMDGKLLKKARSKKQEGKKGWSGPATAPNEGMSEFPKSWLAGCYGQRKKKRAVCGALFWGLQGDTQHTQGIRTHEAPANQQISKSANHAVLLPLDSRQ